MSGYIDLEELKHLLNMSPYYRTRAAFAFASMIDKCAIHYVMNGKHARWEKQDDEFVCTACKAKVKPLPPSTIEVFRYCPGCGAIMDQEEEQ